jgi:hypothetical protein
VKAWPLPILVFFFSLAFLSLPLSLPPHSTTMRFFAMLALCLAALVALVAAAGDVTSLQIGVLVRGMARADSKEPF